MQANSGNPAAVESIISVHGYETGRCGYCGGSNSGAQYWAGSQPDCLSPNHYEQLINRGWRRSGCTLYKIDPSKQCCPHYTIRLEASDFRASRSQRHALNRWNKFILGEEYIKAAAKLYPKAKSDKASRRNEFNLLDSLQECVYSNVKTPPEPAHKLEIALESSDCTPEKFALFKNYQRVVHKEPPDWITEGSFKRFLCDSPLQNSIVEDVDGKKKHLGSYHQTYRLDGRLIALGVIDLLPNCVSSVYLLYHEDMLKWQFGKTSVMSEIGFAEEHGYKFYYMGFYIPNSAKMLYKGDFLPSYLLDIDTWSWHYLGDEMKRLFSTRPHLHFAREPTLRLPNRPPLSHSGEPVALETLTHGDEPAESISAHPPVQDGSKASNSETMDIDAEVVPENAEMHIALPEPDDDDLDASVSLFTRRVPGVLTLSEVRSAIPLEEVKIVVGWKVYQATICLPRGADEGWPDDGTLQAAGTMLGTVAEFVAVVGPDLAREMGVRFA